MVRKAPHTQGPRPHLKRQGPADGGRAAAKAEQDKQARLKKNGGRKMKKAAVAVTALMGIGLTLSACKPAQHPQAPASKVSPTTAVHAVHKAHRHPPGGSHTGALRCGVQRWAVKTGADGGAAGISLSAVKLSTVSALASMPPPAVFPASARISPAETTVYRVQALLTQYKQEADRDYHLVLESGGSQMIAEIPDPACVARSSPLLAGITAARAQFSSRYTVTSSWHRVKTPVTVTGVGFFDERHGDGVAPNGIELHPVLAIWFTSR